MCRISIPPRKMCFLKVKWVKWLIMVNNDLAKLTDCSRVANACTPLHLAHVILNLYAGSVNRVTFLIGQWKGVPYECGVSEKGSYFSPNWSVKRGALVTLWTHICTIKTTEWTPREWIMDTVKLWLKQKVKTLKLKSKLWPLFLLPYTLWSYNHYLPNFAWILCKHWPFWPCR